MNKNYRLAGSLKSTISGKLLYLLLLDTLDARGSVSRAGNGLSLALPNNVVGTCSYLPVFRKNNSITLSQRRVSETLGISQTTVRRNFRHLQREGYIDIIPQYHEDGGRAANKFIVLD
ncbi:MAG: winged helix-turn-helix transcriptional regulator [Oscillospiraceae bacterium]|nr:winged helix-turn-helix transcriptional regulator [Oscillospiraceae bacterium]